MRNIERNAEIHRMRDAKYSYGEIARALGTTRNAVAGVLHRAKPEDAIGAHLPRPRPPEYPARNAEIVAARQAGRTYREIAREMGLTENQVAGVVHRHGRRKADPWRPTA